MFDHYTLTDPYGTFIGGNLPTVPTDRNRPGRNVQLNHHWTVASNLMNEAKFNYSGNGQKIVPVGDLWARSTYGFQFPQLYPEGGTYEDAIPITSITGYAGWNSANAALVSPTQDFAFTDTVTWLKGNHTAEGRRARTSSTRRSRTAAPTTRARSTSAPSGNTKSSGQRLRRRAARQLPHATARRSSTRSATSASSSSRRS